MTTSLTNESPLIMANTVPNIPPLTITYNLTNNTNTLTTNTLTPTLPTTKFLIATYCLPTNSTTPSTNTSLPPSFHSTKSIHSIFTQNGTTNTCSGFTITGRM